MNSVNFVSLPGRRAWRRRVLESLGYSVEGKEELMWAEEDVLRMRNSTIKSDG